MAEKKWQLGLIFDGAGFLTTQKIPDWPGRPGLVARILSMYEQHGLTISQRCKTCRHLEWYILTRASHWDRPDAEQHPFFKCRAFSKENGAATDWRLNWPACGLWEAKEDVDDSDE
jgi:hypothetical protein